MSRSKHYLRFPRQIEDRIQEIRSLCRGSTSSLSEKRILLQWLTEERNPLVLIELCEALVRWKVSAAVPTLLKIAQDKPNSLLAGYCADAVARIGKSKCFRQLEKLETRSHLSSSSIMINSALVRLGDKSRLRAVIRGLSSNNYRTRCMTLSCLSEILTDVKLKSAEISKVSAALWTLEQSEGTEAVRSQLRPLLKRLRSVSNQ